MPRRPRALAITLGVLATALTAAGLAGCAIDGLRDGGRVNTVGAVSFTRPLVIPPLAESTVVDGERLFDLTAGVGSTQFVDGKKTATWGYNGSYLGPTLVAKRGEKVRVNMHNDLDAMTTLHWHGMHLPPAMDGGPHQPIAAGNDWSPHWTIDQPAATLWYHPHPHGETEDQVARGLAGMFIVQDDDESALALPRTYGTDDIPLIVQDTRFNPDNSFNRENRGFIGSLGDTILANGTVGAYLDVTTEALRLRLLNASTARTYDFAFSDSRNFEQIASDGGLLETPLVTNQVQLSPGERAEIVVRFTAGETVVLRSNAPDLGGDEDARNGGADRFDILDLRAASVLATSPQMPAQLAHIAPIGKPTVERSLTFDGTEINSQPMELGRIDQVVTLGSTEAWNVTNDMDLPHNFHIHDVQFRVAAIDGKAPPPELAGWKDTVYLRPHVNYRLVMTFSDYSSPTQPYMYHCHLLWHEDKGMMGQFVVVKPGQHAGTIKGAANDHDHNH